MSWLRCDFRTAHQAGRFQDRIFPYSPSQTQSHLGLKFGLEIDRPGVRFENHIKARTPFSSIKPTAVHRARGAADFELNFGRGEGTLSELSDRRNRRSRPKSGPIATGLNRPRSASNPPASGAWGRITVVPLPIRTGLGCSSGHCSPKGSPTSTVSSIASRGLLPHDAERNGRSILVTQEASDDYSNTGR